MHDTSRPHSREIHPPVLRFASFGVGLILLGSVLLGPALLSLGTGASAQQIRTVPVPFPTIQSAINRSSENDIVAVSPGTYRETIAITKRIIVASTSGPEHTTIDAAASPTPTVTFGSGLDSRTFLRGFTITGSEHCGIRIHRQSDPTVADCVVELNRNTVTQLGGGVASEGQGRFVRTRFLNNLVANTSGIGGGLHGYGVRLTQCTFAGNHATYGGGIEGSGYVSECVFHGNTGEEGAGGIEGAFLVTNSIIWGNVAWYANEIGGATTTYSCVRGGYPGTGNIAVDPRFVDPVNGDFHLRATSPCIDRGSNAATTERIDVDGDPRVAPANGRVDMGADEFFPRLYHVGVPSPGSTIAVSFVGPPAAGVYWAVSTATLLYPVPIPGLLGSFGLDPNTLVVLPLGALASNGTLRFEIPFPSTLPPQTIPTQALIGVQLTAVDRLDIR